MLRIVALVMALPVIAGHAALAQHESAETWQGLTRDLEQLRQELAIPGMSVAVLLDQQVSTVDPAEELIGVFMVHINPNSDIDFRNQFKNLVYQAITN